MLSDAAFFRRYPCAGGKDLGKPFPLRQESPVHGRGQARMAAILLAGCLLLAGFGCRPYIRRVSPVRGGLAGEEQLLLGGLAGGVLEEADPPQSEGEASCEPSCDAAPPEAMPCKTACCRTRRTLHLRDRLRARRLLGPPRAAAEVGYYVHPRFFPVPTRPVFSPRFDALGGLEGAMGPGAACEAERPSAELPLEIDVPPPAPLPEEILTPPPEPQEEDLETHLPRRLAGSSEAPSWIFRAPPEQQTGPVARTASRLGYQPSRGR